MKKHLLAAGLLLASLTSGSHALLLSFDGGPITAGTGDPLSSTFSIDYGYYETEAVDGNFDPLPPFFAADPTASPVTAYTADEINTIGYGPATSGALGTFEQLVLFTFDTPVNLAGFSTILDNSTLGNLEPAQILFYDAADAVLGSITIQQDVANFVATTSVAMEGVKKIMLPSTAFYDDIQLTPGPAPVPEPGMTMLAGMAGLGLALRRRRAAR